jgi:cytochrome o ubiquinol oxidase subunit 1
LDEAWGKRAFWLWFVGFYTAFMPLYVLGLLGMTRRLQHYDRPDWYPWVLAAGVGACLITLGIGAQIIQLAVSIRKRAILRDFTGDPWDGRTLEWATASPPPAFNFAVLPNVKGEEPYWGMKQKARELAHLLTTEPSYVGISVPRNTATGVATAFFAVFLGFAMIWRIYWLAGIGFVGIYAAFVAFAWRDRSEEEISADEVAKLDRKNRLVRSSVLAEGAQS